MKLRIAEEADLPALTVLSAAVLPDCDDGEGNPFYPGRDSVDWYRRTLNDGGLYVFETAERLAGGAVLFENGQTLYVNRVFCAREELFSALMEAVEAQFPEARRIELEAPLGDLGLQTRLERCGYTPVRREKCWVDYLKMPHGEIPASEFLALPGYDGKKVCVTLTTGETFEGECSWSPSGFNEAELGIPEDSLNIDDCVLARSQIARVEVIE